MQGTKFVTARNLKVGQRIEGIKDGNRRRMFSAYVKEILPYKVILTTIIWRRNITKNAFLVICAHRPQVR